MLKLFLIFYTHSHYVDFRVTKTKWFDQYCHVAQIEGRKPKRSMSFLGYIHLDLYHSHPSKCSYTIRHVRKFEYRLQFKVKNNQYYYFIVTFFIDKSSS